MNNFKNFVIIVLSSIIIIQSAFLIYLIRKGAQPGRKKTRLAPFVAPAKEKERAPEPKALLKERPEPEPIASPKVKLGKIAIVLDDWGYNLRNRDFITDNDLSFTLSVLPFKAFSTEVARLAHSKNKDVIVHMPMEPHNKDDYGLEEKTLLTTMDRDTVLKILDQAFESVPYARGISNHMGSLATENTRLMRIILDHLKKREMFFLDSLVTPRSVCRKLAQSLRLRYARRNVFIDNESDRAYIRAQLVKLAVMAKSKGVAVGIGHDRVNTIAVLKEAIPELESQGYEFVNLSEVVQ
jgi:polysaccharide deacetylase 2 family uncharacterized protein YibQ